jgi:hypothetical protein
MNTLVEAYKYIYRLYHFLPLSYDFIDNLRLCLILKGKDNVLGTKEA